MIVVLSLAACGRGSDSNETDTYTYAETGPRPGDTTTGDANVPDTIPYTGQETDVQLVDRTPFYGETLTIFALSSNSNDITAIANEYMRQNPGVTIEITTFAGNLERARHETSIALGDIALPAGAPPVTPPVLIESVMVNPYDTHHFKNWTPFIDATPSFNDYNFFMNVIDAMTADGYLYEFPLTFLFGLVTANHTIPGMTQAMEMHEGGITMRQLLGLTRNFSTIAYNPIDYEEIVSMYFLHNFDAGYGFDFLRGSLETGVADFNNQHFIEFLNHAREVTFSGKVFGEDYAPLIPHVRNFASLVIWRYFFIDIGANANPGVMTAWRWGTRQFFSGATPIVSSQGELIITPAASYVLSTRATPTQQDLAWDFMQFMASEEGTQAALRAMTSREQGNVRERLPLIPINRDAARFTVRADWPATGNLCDVTYMITGTTNRDEAVPIMDRWLDDIGAMPMVLEQTWPDAAHLILEDFHNGAISAAEAAVLIQDIMQIEMAGME